MQKSELLSSANLNYQILLKRIILTQDTCGKQIIEHVLEHLHFVCQNV
jgi:hypothetical protein